MTLQNMIESLKASFPEATESMIVKEIDVAQRKFVSRTRLLRDVGELSNITTYISFTLPTDFKSLIGIYYYDENDDPIYEEDLTIAAEVHRVGTNKKLTFRSTNFTPIDNLPTNISSIQIDYYKFPTAITARSSTLSIPEQYWEALEMMVMIKFMKMFPREIESNNRIFKAIDFGSIRELQREVAAYERDAIEERNVGDDDRAYEVNTCTMIGRGHKPLRSKVTGTTIAIEGGDVSYTKYYRVLVSDSLDYDSGTKYYEVQSTSGFGTINVTVTPATPIITIASPSNEFTDEPATWVRTNQETPYVWNDAGSIDFTPYSSSWGVLEIEIYIYE